MPDVDPINNYKMNNESLSYLITLLPIHNHSSANHGENKRPIELHQLHFSHNKAHFWKWQNKCNLHFSSEHLSSTDLIRGGGYLCRVTVKKCSELSLEDTCKGLNTS